MAQNEDFWNKFWYDKRGRLTVWQRPNALAWIFAVAFVIYLLLPSNGLHSVLGYIALAALLLWALLELFRGDSYYRRILGAGVILLTILAYVWR